MKRVNCYNFYQLGYLLHPLSELKYGAKVKEVLFSLVFAKGWLEMFLNDQLVPLTVCKPKAREILHALDSVLPKDFTKMSTEDGEVEVPLQEIFQITNGVKEFEILLNAELPGLDIYSVSSKGIYSTPLLIDRADDALPIGIKAALSDQAKHDMRQAGRCLAFDLPTASGFHILRAVESVLRTYYQSVTGKPPRVRNWGAYINHLKKHKAGAKTVAILDQIRDLHRNPTMHPEIVLSMNEATVLFDIAKSAIVAMIEEIQKTPASGAKSP